MEIISSFANQKRRKEKNNDKETIICVIIVVLIVSLDIFTQGYTQRATSEIKQIFKELKEEMLIENKEQIDNKVKILDEKWGQKHDALAYYIEHDEIEKVDMLLYL
ncbi:MAG: DUF4363 family protein [Clostridia bacterium]